MIRNYDSKLPVEVNRYFLWLVRRVKVDIRSNPDTSYLLLMRTLFEKEFYWTLPFDEHRAMDGIELREQFFKDKTELGPCSVLEMLVALALRCDRDLLGDGSDRSYVWFWDMIENLGLEIFVDTKFDPFEVDIIIDRWLDRDYESNGCGGLFHTSDPTQDMRNLEIWWQLQLYVIEKVDYEGSENW